MKEEVAAFFDEYASIVNKAIAGKGADIGSMKKCFAPYFVESSPVGIMGGQNDESFAEKIPQGWEFYKEIGIQSMDIVSTDIRPIDEFHAMTTVQWSSAYHKKDGTKGLIGFDISYLLNTQDGIRIFAWITGDEEGTLREHGLME